MKSFTIEVPDAFDLVVAINASLPSVALLRVDTTPTFAAHDAQGWGTSMTMALDVCATKGLAYVAHITLQCWGGCDPLASVVWDVTATLTAAANYPVPQITTTLPGTSSATTLTLADVRRGVIRWVCCCAAARCRPRI